MPLKYKLTMVKMITIKFIYIYFFTAITKEKRKKAYYYLAIRKLMRINVK